MLSGSSRPHKPGNIPRLTPRSKPPRQPKLWLGARRTLGQNSDVFVTIERSRGVQIHREGHRAPRQAQKDHPGRSQMAETRRAKQQETRRPLPPPPYHIEPVRSLPHYTKHPGVSGFTIDTKTTFKTASAPSGSVC